MLLVKEAISKTRQWTLTYFATLRLNFQDNFSYLWNNLMKNFLNFMFAILFSMDSKHFFLSIQCNAIHTTYLHSYTNWMKRDSLIKKYIYIYKKYFLNESAILISAYNGNFLFLSTKIKLSLLFCYTKLYTSFSEQNFKYSMN